MHQPPACAYMCSNSPACLRATCPARTLHPRFVTNEAHHRQADAGRRVESEVAPTLSTCPQQQNLLLHIPAVGCVCVCGTVGCVGSQSCKTCACVHAQTCAQTLAHTSTGYQTGTGLRTPAFQIEASAPLQFVHTAARSNAPPRHWTAHTGKTTLLDILAGRKAHGTSGGLLRGGAGRSTASGEVRINGRLVDARTLCHLVG